MRIRGRASLTAARHALGTSRLVAVFQRTASCDTITITTTAPPAPAPAAAAAAAAAVVGSRAAALRWRAPFVTVTAAAPANGDYADGPAAQLTICSARGSARGSARLGLGWMGCSALSPSAVLEGYSQRTPHFGHQSGGNMSAAGDTFLWFFGNFIQVWRSGNLTRPHLASPTV